MYNWKLKYKNAASTNILTDNNRTGFFMTFEGEINKNPDFSISEILPVNNSSLYTIVGKPGVTGDAKLIVNYFDVDKQPLNLGTAGFVSSFTTPSACFYVAFVLNNGFGFTFDELSVSAGAATTYYPIYLERTVKPIYKTLSKVIERDSDQYFYRTKLDGKIKFIRQDFEFLKTLPFEEKVKIEIQGGTLFADPYKGYFYATDGKWNDDDKQVEMKINPDDLYEDILAGLDKEYNLIKLSPQISQVTLNRRLIIQVYALGDSVLTNYTGGSYWEQEVNDNVFSHADMLNKYKFYYCMSLRVIPAGYSSSLSINVTGEYDDNLVNSNGLYSFDYIPHPYSTKLRLYYLKRVSDNVTLYSQEKFYSSINEGRFIGVPSVATGAFFMANYPMYARVITSQGSLNGTDCYPRPVDDIVPANNNYPYCLGYNTDAFYLHDEYQDFPNDLGKVPDDAPNAGKYYKQLYVSAIAGETNPMPVSRSNWKAVSVWFVRDEPAKVAEYKENDEIKLKDSYEISSVISVLLRSINSTAYFIDDEICSEFLYSDVNPMGGFIHNVASGAFIADQFAGNVRLFYAPKSNVIYGQYDQPAKKASITLQMVFNFLRDTFKLYWFIDGEKLRFEHVRWFQNGQSYIEPSIESDLTTMLNPKVSKSWDFDQNNYDYDKENMPERFEYSWMDDVSPPFQGSAIEILSKFVQKGRTEDMQVGNHTTDLDYVQGTPELVSKDGFVVIAAVDRDGEWITPIVETEMGDNQKASLNNGFLSFTYLHERFHIYDLPSNRVNINDKDRTLFYNITRMKKQDVVFPVSTDINPYKLVRTGLGIGAIDKISINLESQTAKATIKLPTQ